MVSQLVLGIINFAPAVAVLYFLIGPYDAHFRENAMLLAILGGMGLGVLAGIAEIFVLSDAWFLVVLFALPFIETVAKTMLLGLPRFRNNQETVLLGGAVGVGLAAMLLTVYGQVLFQNTPADSWRLVTTLVTVSIGFTLVQYASGLVLGQGPAEGRALGGFLRAYAVLLPAHGLLVMMGLNPATGRVEPFRSVESIEFGILLLVYGVGLLLWKGRAWVVKGLSDEVRRQVRREELAKARGEDR